MFAEDRTAFFSTTDFASAATLNGVAIDGILSRTSIDALGNVQSNSPTFTCDRDAAGAVAYGQTLVVGSDTFKVVRVEDDEGVLTLQLQEQ